MGRFESYPETDALNDNDITLYNHTNNTNKITFINLVNLIKTKLQSIGIIAIDTGVGLLSDGTITSNGTIKCDLKSETPASISSANISTVDNRQYAVGVDKDGHLSVNVPWEGSSTTYSAGSGINIINNTISTKLKSNTQSLLTASSMGSTANRQYAVGLDKDGYLSVNVPWEGGSTIYTAGSGIDISNNTIKVKLKSYTQSSLSSASITSVANKQYAVNLDSNGVLSVNVPWENTTYSSLSPVQYGTDISLVTTGEKYKWDNGGTVKQITVGDGLYSPSGSDITSTGTIRVRLQDYTRSSFRAKEMGSTTADRLYAVGLDYNGDLAVNIPWDSGMLTDGSNAASEVVFNGKFTVGSRKANSTHGTNSVAEGTDITASGNYSHAEGNSTIASGNNSHAEGQNTTAQGVSSHVEGYGTRAFGDYSHAEGYSTTASRDYSHAEGYQTTASGNRSHAEGRSTTASGAISHAEGWSTTASGEDSHAEGIYTTASGAISHAEGSNTTASGNYSHAEGNYGIASGVGSHVEGGILKGSPSALGLYESQDNNTKIVKTSNTSFVSGKTYYVPPFVITPTGGENPQAMKWLELQSGNIYIYSTDTTVNSSKTYYNCDVIFGGNYSQTAKGYFSHSEGNYAVANGNYSHAEGQATKANGIGSHAEGIGCVASGKASHASGYSSTAMNDGQFVYGGYGKKFNQNQNSNGVFGIMPSGQHYTNDTVIPIEMCKNGFGGSVATHKTMTLSLDVLATYQLFVTDSDGICECAIISTSSSTSAQPIVQYLTNTQQNYIRSSSNNKLLIINGVNSFSLMFHLIRIM